MSPPLLPLLKAHIRQNGPLTVAEYMSHCLYYPQHGYYTQGLNFSTTPARDFITAPEITPLFSYTVANWVAKSWQNHGSPTPFTLAEGGPGRGTLMADVLTHLQSAHPACYTAAQPLLIETSPTLTATQKAALQTFPQCSWATELPAQNQPLILLANELLDAYPTHQYKLINNAWNEIVIILSEGYELTFSHQPAQPILPANWQPAEGAILETSPSQTAFLETLKTRATAALIIDYGYRTLPPGGGDTLQALYQHKKISPLEMPGEADLTTHVNFGAVTNTLGTPNCKQEDLAPFLLSHGLIELGLQHPSQQPALHRLLHPAQMGSLFKVVEYNRSTV